MSQLLVHSDSRGDFNLNVLSFSSPISGEIVSVQTKTMQQHFPIRALQPQIQFSVIFASETEFATFQVFVRNHQVDALSSATPWVTLNWPQRNITNWTGLIKQFVAGGQRANYAPRASFAVDLINSLVSATTGQASYGASWPAIYGVGMPDGVLLSPAPQDNSGQAPGTVTPGNASGTATAQGGVGVGGGSTNLFFPPGTPKTGTNGSNGLF